jgi:hypothetical protein
VLLWIGRVIPTALFDLLLVSSAFDLRRELRFIVSARSRLRSPLPRPRLGTTNIAEILFGLTLTPTKTGSGGATWPISGNPSGTGSAPIDHSVAFLDRPPRRQRCPRLALDSAKYPGSPEAFGSFGPGSGSNGGKAVAVRA